MRTTNKSRVLGPPLDGYATIPDLPLEAATVPFVRVEPAELVDAPAPRARGSTPPRPVQRLVQPPVQPPPPAPRSSTAPSVSQVAPSRPRPIVSHFAPDPRSAPPRRIAWGRVVVAIAVASALLGAGISKLLYRGRARAASPAAALAAPPPNLVAVPRHLELGHLALVEARLADAHRSFDTVLLHDPNHAGAIYERALVSPSPAALDEALAGPLAPAQREVLAAYRELADARFVAAISSFTALAARRPDDFHVLRGLFEAQLRGGRGADAMRTFGRLRDVEPRTRMGLLDVLAYAIAHPGAPDLAWARAALDQAPSRSLRARRLVADRDYPAAAALLAGVDAGLAARDPDLGLVRIHLDLATDRLGDLDDAVAALEPRRPASHLAYRLALAHARGDADALARWLSPEALDAIDRADAAEITELVPIAIALGHAELLDRVVRGLDRQPGPTQRAVSHQLARVLLGDTAASPYPEVDAVAQAVAAERAGDWKAAAAAWRAAVPLSLDGRTLAVEQLGIARGLYHAGDLDGAAAACRDVLEPRALQPHWGVAAADCYAWSVEAALDRRDRATALDLVERFAALRAPGGTLDPVLRRVRALLVQ